MTIHLDEEIGGILGMMKFVKHEEFKKLDVGFALDEGKSVKKRMFGIFLNDLKNNKLLICWCITIAHYKISH